MGAFCVTVFAMKRVQTQNVCCLLVCLVAAVGVSAQDASAPGAPVGQAASGPVERVVAGVTPRFTLRVPAEFESVTPVGKGVTYAFVRGDGPSRVVLNLIPFATEFRKEPLDAETLEVPVDRRYELSWKGLTVVVYDVAQRVDGQDVVVLNAAVPTRNNGLVVQLAGPRAMRDEMTRLLPTLLEGLDAPTPEKKSGFDRRNATLLLILGMLIIIVTLRRHQTMRKRQAEADESRRRAAWGDEPRE